MKLTFLGTAAAEAIPALFCECPTCREAMVNKGKDIRRRTCYLIDDDTLVDFGPDIFAQTLTFGVDLLKIQRIPFTPAHEDHFNCVDPEWRHPGYSRVTSNIDIYGNMRVMNRIATCMIDNLDNYNLDDLHMNRHVVRGGDTLRAGDLDVLAIPANHSPYEEALTYFFTRNGKTLLIANDTGYWKSNAWDVVAAKAPKIDIAVLESTCGTKYPNVFDGHMGLNATVAMRNRLAELHLIDESTQVFTTHFSHNGVGSHQSLIEAFSPYGIVVAYDGLTVEV